MEPILIPFIVFSCIFGIAFIYLTTRNRERLALIEKGASADLFQKESKSGYWLLKLGLVAIGVSAGILFANMMIQAGLLEEEVAFPAMIFLFAGSALVLSFFLAKRLEEKDKEKGQ